MTQIIRNNHYISQFYIKGFYDKTMWFYDKKLNKYYKNIASNMFYKKNMNVVTKNGIECDEIERIQAILEGQINSMFLQFQQYIENYGNTRKYDKELFELIIFFAYFTFWRNPQNDNLYNNIKAQINVDLVLKILNKYFMIQIQKDENDEFGNLFKRTLLSYIMLDEPQTIQRIVKHSRIIGTDNPSLLNDYPLLCSGEANFSKIIGSVEFKYSDFIFPLTKNLTFVYSENIAWNEIDCLSDENNTEGINIEMFTNSFSFFRDTALFINAGRFIGCEDENRLKKIIKTNLKDILMFPFLKNYKEFIKKYHAQSF